MHRPHLFLALTLRLLFFLILAARVLPSTPPLSQSIDLHSLEGQLVGFAVSGIHGCPQTSQTATFIHFQPMPPIVSHSVQRADCSSATRTVGVYYV